MVMANMRAVDKLARRTDAEAALDTLLAERPLLLQLPIENWLVFFSAYGVRVRRRADGMLG
jgi:hypothetical protein